MIDSGEILYENQDINKLNTEQRKLFRRSNIGMVFQSFDLLPILNVRENILLPTKLNHLKLDESYFNEIVKTLGIETKLKNRINELSGGEQQRVAIARALINRPAVLFADEPSGNLDTRTKEEIHNLFFRLRDKYGQTVVIVTHDPDLAKMCDRSLFMVDGQFV